MAHPPERRCCATPGECPIIEASMNLPKASRGAVLGVVALGALGCDAGPGLTTLPGGPTTSAVVCGGFPMPNPAATGLPHRQTYADNGDGTITDEVTHLVWQRDVATQGFPQEEA